LDDFSCDITSSGREGKKRSEERPLTWDVTLYVFVAETERGKGEKKRGGKR